MLNDLMAHHYFLMLFVATGMAAAVVSLIHKKADQEILKNSNDVTSAVYNMIGVLLALVLGFLIVEAYGDYATASSEAQSEATQLKQVHHLADLFEPEQKAKLQAASLNYIKSIREQEWPAMLSLKHGHPDTNTRLRELWMIIRTIEIKGDRASSAFDKIIDHMAQANELRNQRLNLVHNNIPQALWVLFISVAATSILSLGLFGNTNVKHQRLLAAMVSGVLASCIFMIHMLDNPYAGPLKIEPDAFFVESSELPAKAK
ncbi:MAG: DUF4239 domain-containing protein, partial [bacterium]